MQQNLSLRPAKPDDAELILSFITELAIFEKAEHCVEASVESIHSSLLSMDSNAHALICQDQGVDIGFVVYFYNYSTWLGKKGLYLEDLYISPEFRSRGAGKFVLQQLAKIAVEQDCGRFEWSVLDWNTPAIKVYEKIGAKAQPEWISYRMDKNELEEFAKNEQLWS